jgi:hypothetical protein
LGFLDAGTFVCINNKSTYSTDAAQQIL